MTQHPLNTSATLERLLPRWRGQIPLYREQAERGLSGPRSAEALLDRRPLITKQDIRRNFPRNFLGETASLEDLIDQQQIELEQTAGTSEQRTSLLLPRGWWAEQESRALRFNRAVAALLDECPGARRISITSPVCSGDICYTGVPSHDERIVGNALFLSLSRYPFLWGEADLARMAAEAIAWQPRFLDVDPVYGVVFARYCERLGIRLPTLRFILCSYEFVSVVHRRILERVFGVPVFNLYGSTETGHLLMEDETGQMRPSRPTAFLETLPYATADRGHSADSTAPGPAGHGAVPCQPTPPSELIVTTLSNPVMPLIRYRIGDLVEEQAHSEGVRYVVHGRILDALHTMDGQLVTTLEIDECFAELAGIAHYQVLESKGEWLVRYVPDQGGPSATHAQQVRDRLADLLGQGGTVRFETTDLLVPEASGKFRLGYPARPGQ